MVINRAVIEGLRKEYGEAFYLLDSDQFRTNFQELKEAFSAIYPNFNIAYSYKTNYTPKFCRIVNELGGYAEVVSELEMELAHRCGVDYSRIIWNGPIKDEERMSEFLLAGGTVNIDSISEAEYIKELAVKANHKLNVGIRCNYDVADGVVSRFGFDVDGEDFKKVLEIVTTTPNLHFINFQCHFAKRQIEYWPARAKGMVELLDRVGVIPERVDIGGGLFGKMADSLKAQFTSEIPGYKKYAEAAATVFAEYFKDKEVKPELIIEPGSAVVGDCMKFVGTVKTIKNVRGKYFASVLGSQKNISMTGINPPMEVVHMSEGQEYEGVDLVGFTCIEGDVLYKNYTGELAVGDAIVISNCGSYSLVMKPPFILPNFPVLDICGDEVEVIKRAETFDDIFHTFNY
ncbi:MAG: alanine racemase [Segatella copri]